MTNKNEFVTITSVCMTTSGSASTSIPMDVQDHLNNCGQIAWFVDREAGRLYVVPSDEVRME